MNLFIVIDVNNGCPHHGIVAGRYNVVMPFPREVQVGQLRGDRTIDGLRSMVRDTWCANCDAYLDLDIVGEPLTTDEPVGTNRCKRDDSASDVDGESSNDDDTNDDVDLSQFVRLDRNLHWNCELCTRLRDTGKSHCGCGCDSEHDGWDEPDYWVEC